MQLNKFAERPARRSYLPFALPSIGEAEISEVVDTLCSGWVTTGPKVKHFEANFSKYVGARHCAATSSCTAALHIALTALDVGLGSEVIVPTMTFCASANVVVHLGATPVLVDVQPDFNVAPETIEEAITPQTKAIMIVHYGGQSCDLAPIYDIAARHDLPIVEDAAHAVGSTYHGHRIGSDALLPEDRPIRRIAAFSFYATKNMTTGEGGMIATSDDNLAEHMRMLTLHGMNRDAWKRYSSAGSWYYEVVLPGYKANMTDIQAALGIHQLKRLDDFIETRQQYARLYDEAFADIPEIAVPITHPGHNHVYHLYPIRLDLKKLTIDRADFIEALKALNIGTSVHFIPVHLHPYYQKRFGYRRGDLPGAEAVYDCTLSLPLYPRMSKLDVEDVVRAVRYVVETNRRYEGEEVIVAAPQTYPATIEP
jgi:dTDP-4-amino-4,6-dideoxygalactose transaminase